MANVHIYFGIENLALTTNQRNTLVAGLQALGVANAGDNPAQRNHWRVRLDNQAVIFEALFNEDNISIVAIKQRLATIYGINVSLIGHTIQQTVYGLLVTFSRSGTDRLRMIAFGHDGNSWPARSVSGDAARAYLAANIAAWENTE